MLREESNNRSSRQQKYNILIFSQKGLYDLLLGVKLSSEDEPPTLA